MANWIMTNWYIKDKVPYIVIGTAGENNATSISIECDEIIENAEYFLDIGDTTNDIFNTQELTVKQQTTPTGEISNILYLKPMRSFLGKEGVKLLQVRCEYIDNDEKVTKESNVFHAVVNKNTGFSYKFDVAIFQQYLNKVKELAAKVAQDIANLTLGDLKDTNIVNPTDGQVIKYDAETQKWVNGESSSGDMLASVYDPNGDVANAGGIEEYIGERTGDIVTPQMYGAKADGITDDSEAVKQAVAHQGLIYFPKGEYLIDWYKVRQIVTSDITIYGDGKFDSIIKLKYTHNDGNFGSAFTFIQDDNTLAPIIDISNIGFVYDNDVDDTPYPSDSYHIWVKGFYSNIHIHDIYSHIGGSANVLPPDTSVHITASAETVLVENSLFENFNHQMTGGGIWVIPSTTAGDVYDIGQVIIRNNKLLNAGRDEAIGVYTVFEVAEQNIRNIVIDNNIIIHGATENGDVYPTDGLISVYGTTSQIKGNAIISNNKLSSSKATQELIRVQQYDGATVIGNVFETTGARNDSDTLRGVRFINGKGVVQDNRFICTVANNWYDLGNNTSDVVWIDNTFSVVGNMSIDSAITDSTDHYNQFKNNYFEISNSNAKMVMRKTQQYQKIRFIDNVVNGDFACGAMNGNGLEIVGNRFRYNLGSISEMVFVVSNTTSSNTPAVVWENNSGIILAFYPGYYSTPISSFKYIGSRKELQLRDSTNHVVFDDGEVRRTYFATSEIYYLDNDLNTSITSPQNGDILVYEDGKWENNSIDNLATKTELRNYGALEVNPIEHKWGTNPAAYGSATVDIQSDGSANVVCTDASYMGVYFVIDLDLNNDNNITLHFKDVSVAQSMNIILWHQSISVLQALSVETGTHDYSIALTPRVIREYNITTPPFRLLVSCKANISYNLNIELESGENTTARDLLHDFDKKLYGKKVIFLGDSITQLQDKTNPGRSWVDKFIDWSGAIKIANTAVIGAVMKDYEDTVLDGDPKSSEQHNNTLSNQVQKIINEQYEAPDIIMIAIGTNDTSIEANITTITATYYNENTDNIVPLTNVDRTTSEGAFRYCNEKLHNLYPNAIICWCNPIPRAKLNTFQLIQNKADAFKILTQYGSVNNIETNRCGIFVANEINGVNGECLIDGLHPNAEGATRIAKYNIAQVVNLL